MTGPEYSNRFYFVHKSGDKLFPVKLESRSTGRSAFRVWLDDKDKNLEVSEKVMAELVLKNGYAVRMRCPETGRNGGYKRDGNSIVRVVVDE